MSDFAKIIRATDGAQVLVFKDYGDKGPELCIMMDIDGATARIGMEFTDGDEDLAEVQRDSAFANFDVQQADAIRHSALPFGVPA